jgi:hypothetical protein
MANFYYYECYCDLGRNCNVGSHRTNTIYVSILRKNQTKALIYVNTTLLALLHCYMFQPSRGHPQGGLIDFVSKVNTMRCQMYITD